MSNEMEKRYTANLPSSRKDVKIEERADQPSLIIGYAAVFYNPSDPGTAYRMYDWMEERILPGAFDRAIKEKHDARALFNHDPSNILGRVSADTCRLSVDAVGLRYEIEVPDTQAGRDLVTSIQRGDISGSSFAFRATRVTWGTEMIDGKDVEIREIQDLDLGDVGPVTYPAYQATSADTRSAGADEQALKQEWLQQRSKPTAVNICQRLAEIDLHQLE